MIARISHFRWASNWHTFADDTLQILRYEESRTGGETWCVRTKLSGMYIALFVMPYGAAPTEDEKEVLLNLCHLTFPDGVERTDVTRRVLRSTLEETT